ncbi:MAG: trimethylamine methyltransferase family protein [Chloroflexi bacterium]|nr:trimethylamine methyltransferase family protein [Chloroflexota bacterium]
MTDRLRVRPLTGEEVADIYERCVTFLSTKGVRVDHQRCLEMMHKAGAQVDFTTNQLRFPRDIIEAAIRAAPRSYIFAARGGRPDMVLPHPKGLFYSRTGTGGRSYIEPATNTYRDVSLADVAEVAQLIDVLDGLDICAYPTPRDMPEATADIHALKVLFENTAKHIMLQNYSGESLEYQLELAVVMAGSKEALARRPIVHTLTGCLTPLVLQDVFAETIIKTCEYGVPMGLSSLPSAGGTSPVTIAGTVFIAAIEILTTLVITQLIKPGLPVYGFPITFAIDMMTGRNRQSSAESILMAASAIQFVKEALKLPAHTYGFGTDGYIPDAQAAIEATLRGAMISSAGADILGGAGQLNVATAISPIQLVIDDTIAPVLRRITGGVKVDEDTLAVKDIWDTVPGSHFLERTHTLKHCREVLRTDLLSTQSREVWTAEGSKDLFTRAREKYQELKKTKMRPQPVPDEVRREMEKIVKHADAHMVK